MTDPKTTLKLGEIATRIAAHLYRMEHAQKDYGSAKSSYWHSNAWSAGSKVRVRYISVQGDGFSLTKADALEYLRWLDAGNEGKHYTALSFNTRIKESVNGN